MGQNLFSVLITTFIFWFQLISSWINPGRGPFGTNQNNIKTSGRKSLKVFKFKTSKAIKNIILFPTRYQLENLTVISKEISFVQFYIRFKSAHKFLQTHVRSMLHWAEFCIIKSDNLKYFGLSTFKPDQTQKT